MADDPRELKKAARAAFPELAVLRDDQIQVVQVPPRNGTLGTMAYEVLGRVKDGVVWVARAAGKVVLALIFVSGCLSAIEHAGYFLMPDTAPSAKQICISIRNGVVEAGRTVADAFEAGKKGVDEPERFVAVNPSWDARPLNADDLQNEKATFDATDIQTLSEYKFIPASGLDTTIVSSTSATTTAKTSLFIQGGRPPASLG